MLFLKIPLLAVLLATGDNEDVKPEAWLSTGSNPGPDHQMLVCHVSGFHPKPIWVFLDVEATETSGLYCWVRHSSLGGQDILLYLEHQHNFVGLIILAVMVALVLLTALAFWLRKHWSHCEPPAILLPLE
uniref:Uncharacterized protein n=1 Tax=Myotis myotis TaxID=51298 RepID=A0A7J7WHG9_MYOMY|nr:hypothetical protein mMyoMyo1_012032 [Myotis myotis]